MDTQNDGLEHVSRILLNMAQPFLVSMLNFWGVDSWTLVVGGWTNPFEKNNSQLGSFPAKKSGAQKKITNKQKNAAKRNETHHLYQTTGWTSTIRGELSQNGNPPQIGVKIKKIFETTTYQTT